MDTKKQYDEIGKDYIKYQKTYFGDEDDPARVFIKSHLVNLKGKTILDVGCGGGLDILAYKKMGAESVFGIDTSQTMIDEAKNIVGNLDQVMIGDFENIPFPNNSFDYVVSRFGLHYLDSFDAAYSELSRVLKKDGIMVMVVNHPYLSSLPQNVKIIDGKQMAVVKLYDDKVAIVFPPHNFSDYFSPEFFAKFNLSEVWEKMETGVSTNKNTLTALGFVAVEKTLPPLELSLRREV